LGCGLKLLEQLATHPSTGTALIILLASMPEPRGGGDLVKYDIIGRWVGDRVIFIGDYAEKDDFKGIKGLENLNPEELYHDLQSETVEGWKDISMEVCRVIENELEGKYEGDNCRRFVNRRN